MANAENNAPHNLSALRIDEAQRRGRPVGKWLGWFAAVLGLLIIVGGAASMLLVRKPEVTVAAAALPDDSPAAATLLNASGYVTPRRRATVAAKITGKVRQVFIDEGVRVTRGQVLATLDDSDYQVALIAAKADRDAIAASIAQLEVQLGNAEREVKRTKDLTDAGIQTTQMLDAAQTVVDRLKAQIAQARTQVQAAEAKIAIENQNIENCQVRSPYDGIVVTKDAQPGEMVSPISAGGGYTRTGIATIVDMASNEIEVDVNENYIARIKPGQHVIATLDAYPDWQIPSRVRTVIPTADREKGTVKVRVSFDQLDARILPDMGVKVAFLSDELAAKPGDKAAPKAVAMVPLAAVRGSGSLQFVFLFRDGIVERRAIGAGRPRETNIDVLAGLAPGDLVVVSGPDDLADGQQVTRKP